MRSSHRKSRVESMETTEEDGDEDISGRNLAYKNGGGRSLSRNMAAVNMLLVAVNAAALDGGRNPHGSLHSQRISAKEYRRRCLQSRSPSH